MAFVSYMIRAKRVVTGHRWSRTDSVKQELLKQRINASTVKKKDAVKTKACTPHYEHHLESKSKVTFAQKAPSLPTVQSSPVFSLWEQLQTYHTESLRRAV